MADRQTAAVTAGRPLFTINGRFLTQPVTGVQRYAGEITLALDALLQERGAHAQLMVPRVHGDVPQLRAMQTRTVAPLGGHAWEQTMLPIRARGPLLNLCNTGPLAQRRQVVCMHDANVFREPGSYSRGFRWTYRSLLPLLARGGARITTVSSFSARQLAEVLSVSPAAITVLPNGHEHAFRWSAGRSTLLRANPPDKPFVLLLGSRARHKNMGLVLGLADRMAEDGIDLYVAGGGAAVFAETVAVSHPAIRWLGRVDDDDLAALFGAALCLAFPSLTEGFGLPVVEAMALGCPVVSSDRASLPEVCGEAALMASPTDPSAWLAHFLALAGSRGLGEDLRGRGRDQAKLFSWTRSAAGYLDLLASWP